MLTLVGVASVTHAVAIYTILVELLAVGELLLGDDAVAGLHWVFRILFATGVYVLSYRALRWGWRRLRPIENDDNGSQSNQDE